MGKKFIERYMGKIPWAKWMQQGLQSSSEEFSQVPKIVEIIFFIGNIHLFENAWVDEYISYFIIWFTRQTPW